MNPTSLRRIGLSIILAWGWKRGVIATLAGAVSSLAMAPFNAWPVLFVTFPIAVWLIDGAAAGSRRGIPAAALTGWLFGFGFFVPGLYWIGHAFLVDADTFGWLLPVAVMGLPAYLALYTAAGFALARALWTPNAWRIVVLAAALTLAEWLRGHLLSGFPWNSFGYALSEPLALAQIASVIGLWGMTLLAVAIFATPATLIDGSSGGRRPWLPPALGVAALLGMAIFGGLRLAQMPTTLVDGVKLRIMQPNIAQDKRFNYSAKTAVMSKYLELSDRSTSPQSTGIVDANILIWPESAFPFFLAREADAMAQIAGLLPPGTVLITGAVRPPETPPGQRITRAYNSVYVIDHDGTFLSTYDKTHLVPFGEYLPLQSLLEKIGLEQLTKVKGGFIAGNRRRLMSVPNAPPMLPLICYEVIFPGAALPAGERPGWIVNLTNDGWFGHSTGPYQHLQQARVRAIEEGLPIVRAANTGVSAVIDPVGRVTGSLALGQEGVLDALLPKAVPRTIYSRLSDYPVGAVVLGILILSGWRRTRGNPAS